MAITKGDLLEFLGRAYQAELAFASGIAEIERTAGGTEQEWAPKDLLAHLAAWKGIMTKRLAAYRRGEDSDFTSDYDTANAEIFTNHKGSTWEEIMDMVDRSYRGLDDGVKSLGEGDINAPALFNWQRSQPLANRVALNGYFHPIWHVAEARLDRGDRGGALELVRVAVRDMLRIEDSAYWQAQYTYNLACFQALAGENKHALVDLREAFALDSGMVEWAGQDADLKSLHGDPEFQALMSALER